MGDVLLTNLAVVAALHTSVWLLSLARRDASVVDPFWGVGFVLIAWASALRSAAMTPSSWLVVAMVTAWGMRLSLYLAWRNWGKPEDHRYAAMRAHHGAWFPLVSLGTVFALQALLTWIVSLPVQAGVALGPFGGPLAAAGAAVWLVGIGFETVGDWQLARFKADPVNRGNVMNRGLWRYTRHPNYFGDFLVWWGLTLAAAGPAHWWWTWIGPAVMSVLLMRVSGVTLLEKSLAGRLAGYEEYVRDTSAFFPAPPKRAQAHAGLPPQRGTLQ